MKRLVMIAGLSLALGASAQSPPPSGAASPLGRWVTASGNVEVEVAACGAALCGTVVDVLANRSMSRDGGEMKAVDSRNPIGMKVLIDFVPTEFAGGSSASAGGTEKRAPTEWQGRIYNREKGKTYRCVMRMGTAGELTLRGYVGLRWFGSTQTWQRPRVSLGDAR